MSTQRACDVCHFYRQRPDGTAGVKRYTLRLDQRARHGGRLGTQKTMGSIDLCDQCWDSIAKPRTNPLKVAASKAAWERRKAAAA